MPALRSSPRRVPCPCSRVRVPTSSVVSLVLVCSPSTTSFSRSCSARSTLADLVKCFTQPRLDWRGVHSFFHRAPILPFITAVLPCGCFHLWNDILFSIEFPRDLSVSMRKSIQPWAQALPFRSMPAQAISPTYTLQYNYERGILADVYLPLSQHRLVVPA